MNFAGNKNMQMAAAAAVAGGLGYYFMVYKKNHMQNTTPGNINTMNRSGPYAGTQTVRILKIKL